MSLPAGPKAPTAFQTLHWITRPTRLMRKARRRYGRIFTVKFAAFGPTVFISDPTAIKQIFTGDPDLFLSGETNIALLPILGRHSVLLAQGDAHMRQRRLLLPQFHGERIRTYERLITEVTDQEVDRLPLGHPVRLQDSMQEITLEVIMRAVFGLNGSHHSSGLRAALRKLMRSTDHRIARFAVLTMMHIAPRFKPAGRTHPIFGIQRLRAAVDHEVYAEIARRREDPLLEEREDIMSLLLQARDEDGSPMSDEEIRDELVTLLIAGHETTATTLAWTFAELVRSPAALERLTDEARLMEGSSYADAVVAEALRLRPPISIVLRRLARPTTVLGEELPAGTVLAPCIYLTQREPSIYEQPNEFHPERFLDSKPDTYSWLPFGGGIRRCIGASFANLEMRLVLQRMAARLTFAQESQQSPERTRLRSIVFAPNRGGQVTITDRVGGPAADTAADAVEERQLVHA